MANPQPLPRVILFDEESESASDSEDDQMDEILPNERRSSDEQSIDSLDDDDDDRDDPSQPARPPRRGPDRMVLGRDNNTAWTLQPRQNMNPPPIIGRLHRAAGEVVNLLDPLEIFNHFFTIEMVDLILRHTNNRIIENRGVRAEDYETRALTANELWALLGLLYFSGLMKNSFVKVEELWSEQVGPAIFHATLSANRFKFLLRKLRFDDEHTRENRVPNDRFALFREIWDLFIQQCQRNYSPSSYMTIDETLLSYRGRCGFRIYMPDKPQRYGLKIYGLADARTSYFYNGFPYANPEVRQRDGPTIPTQQVLRLIPPIVNTNRTVTLDNYFCSMELADALNAQGISMIGTLKKNKREIPPRMLRARRQDIFHSRFVYQQDRVLTSYVPRYRKVVLLLSTAHVDGRLANDGKPEIINFYNSTKSGVDTLNQLIAAKSTNRKTRRWTMRCFFGLLDIAAVNAYIIHRSNGGEMNRLDFLKTLSERLVRPYLLERLANPRIQRSIKLKIRSYLRLPLEAAPQQAPARRGKPKERCHFCPRSRDRKAIVFCYHCGLAICGEHRREICFQCYDNC